MTKEELIDEIQCFHKRLLDDRGRARTSRAGRPAARSEFDSGYRAAYYDVLMEVTRVFELAFEDELNLEEDK